MPSLPALFLGITLCLMATTPRAEEPKGVIAATVEDGNRVIVKLVDDLPGAAIRAALPWRTVVSWEYDGSASGGMPDPDTIDRMIALERTIRQKLEREGFLLHAYSRTGNHLKQFVFYANDREAFVRELNAALAGQDAYPITVEFHEDAAWSDFRSLRAAVTGKP